MKKLLTVAVAAMTLAGTVNAQTAGNAKAAESKVAMCIGCHAIPGYRISYPEIYTVPLLGGQNAAYIVSALANFNLALRRVTGIVIDILTPRWWGDMSSEEFRFWKLCTQAHRSGSSGVKNGSDTIGETHIEGLGINKYINSCGSKA